MIHDWSEGKVAIVFQNINLQIPEFRHQFLCHLKTLDILLQKQLALTYDVNYKDSTFLRSCQLHDILIFSGVSIMVLILAIVVVTECVHCMY